MAGTTPTPIHFVDDEGVDLRIEALRAALQAILDGKAPKTGITASMLEAGLAAAIATPVDTTARSAATAAGTAATNAQTAATNAAGAVSGAVTAASQALTLAQQVALRPAPFLQFTMPDRLAVGKGTVKFPIPFDLTIAGITGSVTPGGGQIIADINKDDVSIFGDATKRPSFAAGAQSYLRQPVGVFFPAGSMLSIDIDAIGTAVAAAYAGSSTSTTSADGSVVSLPVPTGVVAGDELVAHLISSVGGNAGSPPAQVPYTVIIPPKGWIEAGPAVRQATNTGARDFELHTFVKRYDGAKPRRGDNNVETTTFDFVVTVPTTNSGASGTLTGYHGANKLDTYAAGAALVNVSTPAAPSVNAALAGEFLVVAFSNRDGSVAVPTLPSGFTWAVSTGRTLVAYKLLTAAGDTGTTALTGANASSSEHWTYSALTLGTAQDDAAGRDLVLVADLA